MSNGAVHPQHCLSGEGGGTSGCLRFKMKPFLKTSGGTNGTIPRDPKHQENNSSKKVGITEEGILAHFKCYTTAPPSGTLKTF